MRGLASKLESIFCSHLVKNDLDYCLLSSFIANNEANSFYEKQGYEIIKKSKNQYYWCKVLQNKP